MLNLICSNGYVCRMCVITTWMEMSCVYNIITPSDLYQLSLQLLWKRDDYTWGTGGLRRMQHRGPPLCSTPTHKTRQSAAALLALVAVCLPLAAAELRWQQCLPFWSLRLQFCSNRLATPAMPSFCPMCWSVYL